MRVALTDAPACGYDHVWVTVEKVRVNQSAGAADTDAGWSDVTLSPAKRVDLLTLTNGVLSELGQTSLPAGNYTQLRLVLATNDTANPLANSVVPTGGSETALNTPSAQQSGLKLNANIQVQANQLADVVLDFNACKSVVRAGNSGNYQLKPVVSVIPRLASGVQGYVDASVAMATTSISLQQSGTVVKATVPDSTGKFTLAPVAAGTYDLVVTSAGHATEVVTGVTVTADTITALNTSATAFAPPASATGILAGAVATGVTPIDASVNVMQTVGSTHTIEVAGGPIDATTGAYTQTVAVGAPMVAAYVASPGTMTFAADATAAGKFSLNAVSGTTTKTAGPLTLAGGATITTNFTFP